MEIIQQFQLDKKHGRIFGRLFFFSLMYVLPIFLIDMYYKDDLARSLYGATGWKGDGRPLGETLVVWLSGGGSMPVVDIAPLPLLLSIVLLSYALVLYAQHNWGSAVDEYLGTMVLLFVLTNPFAMENLSYRFNCIMMFSALAIPFVMYAILDQMPRPVILVLSAVCTSGILALYQPAVGACLVLSALYVWLFCVGEKKQLTPEIYRIAGIAAGAVIYKLIIAPRYMNGDDWRSKVSGIMSPAELLPGVIGNIRSGCQYMVTSAAGMSKIFVCTAVLLMVFAVLAAVFVIGRDSAASRTHRALKIAVTLLVPVIAFVLSFMPLTLLEGFHLNSRMLISCGGVLFLVGIMLLYACRGRKLTVRVGALLCALCLLGQYGYMYTYAAALRGQNEYHKYLVYNIAHDVESINCDGAYSMLTVIGSAPRPRQTGLICGKYPFLEEIVPVYITKDTWIGGAWLYMYMQEGLSLEEPDDSDRKVTESGNAVLRNSIYSCYTNDDKIIVCFHSQ